jgi:hypothetical protein
MVIHQVIEKANVVIAIDDGIDYVPKEFEIGLGSEALGGPPGQMY